MKKNYYRINIYIIINPILNYIILYYLKLNYNDIFIMYNYKYIFIYTFHKNDINILINFLYIKIVYQLNSYIIQILNDKLNLNFK